MPRVQKNYKAPEEQERHQCQVSQLIYRQGELFNSISLCTIIILETFHYVALVGLELTMFQASLKIRDICLLRPLEC